MAQKKAGGSSKNGRDSNPKNLGIKCYNNCFIKKGGIILRQNGLKYKPGKNVYFSNNFNLHSLVNGLVIIYKKKKKCIFDVKCL